MHVAERRVASLALMFARGFSVFWLLKPATG